VVGINVCGNGILEAGNAEACDDGNTTAGDGCSATCTFEPDATYVGPGPQTFTGALQPAGDEDYYQVTVTQPSLLIIDAGTPTLAGCPTDDLNLTLLTQTGTQLATDTFGGSNFCPRISGLTNASARVQAGTYIVRVREPSLGALASYEVRIETRALNICGNGLQETGELCDDGNTVSGDGCGATCQVDVDGTFTGPSATGTTFAAGIESVGDFDNYEIVLTAPSMVRIEANDPADPLCGNTTFTPELRLFNAGGAQIEVDTIDGPGSCSLIGERLLPAGTYRIRIAENGDNATLAAYALVVNAQAVTPDGGTISGFTTPDVTFTGDLAVVGDADIFQIDLTQTGRLIVDVGTTAVTTCPSGTTTLRLFNNLGHELAFDNTDGPSSCSAFLATDLLDVPAGTYYVILEENGRNSSFAQYTIRFDVQAPPAYVCGDNFRNLTEQCDDGNVLGGDGCSPTCTLENAGFVVETEFNGDPRGAQNLGTLAPGQTVDVSASLYAADTDWFRFTLAGAASVRLNTYQTPGSTLTSCPMDSVMWLHSGIPGDYNATSSSSTNNQPTLVEYDDDDGNGSCSIISGTDTAPTARALTAGTYYVLVRRFGTAPGTVGQYYLNVTVTP
jgi:cysteine-rich repeat protein